MRENERGKSLGMGEGHCMYIFQSEKYVPLKLILQTSLGMWILKIEVLCSKIPCFRWITIPNATYLCVELVTFVEMEAGQRVPISLMNC